MAYDLIVIGGGAGGMAAARAGRRRDKRVLLVQDGAIGGDCTFTGCVPSKALIAAAARGESFTSAMANAKRAIEQIAATEDADVFRREGIEVIEARARFVSSTAIEVDGRRIEGDRFVVATGTAPLVPSIEGLDQTKAVTSDDVWDLAELPARLGVLGGGAIGCELAQAFARLGSEVTVFEAADRLLGKEEPEVSSLVAGVFATEGITVRTGEKVVRVEPIDDRGGARISTDGDGQPVEVDRVLVAIGRRAITDGLGVETAGIELDDREFVKTDAHLRTSVPTIYAAGDIAGKLQFTHAADEMGRIAAGNALGGFRMRRFKSERIPWVTFVSPEVARVGMSEAEAAESSPGARVAYLPLDEVDRAVAEGNTNGFLKLIAGPRWLLGDLAGGRFLGATIVAPRAGEMIHEIALAIRASLFPAHLGLAVHAYPTWSVGVQKAVGQFFYEVEGREARPASATTGRPGS